MSGLPFHRCTHTALSPKGEIYVSDGYGNARVHKYSPDGKLLHVVGRAGHRSRPIQHPAQHRHRRRGLGVRRRPREPPRPGVRRQRQVRDAMGEHAPALRAVLLRRTQAAVHHRRARPVDVREPRSTRTSARGCRSSTARASSSRGSAARRARARAGKFIAPHGLAVDCARRHLRRRGELHRVSAAVSPTRRSPGACARCRSCRNSNEAAGHESRCFRPTARTLTPPQCVLRRS